MSPLPTTSPVRRPPFAARTTSYDPTVSTASEGEGSSSHSLITAPTPFNTYFAPAEYAHDTRSLPGGIAADEKDEEADSFSDGVLYTPLRDEPSGPIHRTMSNPSTGTPTASRVDSWYSNGSHADSHLLSPSPRRERPAESPLPLSKKPIPAPPRTIRNALGSSNETATLSASIVSPPAPPPLIKITSDCANAKQVSFAASDESGTSDLPSLPKGTVAGLVRTEDVDAARLQQLGYDAVFGREYNFWSSLFITMSNIGCTQGVVLAAAGALTYGGPLMVIVAWPLSCVGILLQTLTLSELASAFPVAGAMASWSWKMARGSVGGERVWGWVMGGTVLGGHIGNMLLVTWAILEQIMGLMHLAFDYEQKSWISLLFFWSILLTAGIMQSTPFARSHRFWLGGGIYMISVWAVLSGTMAYFASQRVGESILSQPHFYNFTGWSSKGYVYVLGWISCTLASGADASAHMAEETKNPSRNVPLAMVVAVFTSYLLGYIAILLTLACIRPEQVATLVKQPNQVGFILRDTIGHGGAVAISILIVITLVLQECAQLQASSRFIFALARDNALPFSSSIRRTNSSNRPLRALWLVVGLCVPFSFLVFASSGNILFGVIGVGAGVLMSFSYMCPIILYLISKKNLQIEGRTSWSLRSFSKPVAVLGALFSFATVALFALPNSRPITARNFSYSLPVLIGTLTLSFITWHIYGSKHYSGPIRALTKWETGVEIDLQSTLAERSRSSALHQSSVGQQRHTASSFKEDQFEPVDHVVTVGSARTIDDGMTSEFIGSDGQEYTVDMDGGDEFGHQTGTDTGTDSTITRQTFGRLYR